MPELWYFNVMFAVEIECNCLTYFFERCTIGRTLRAAKTGRMKEVGRVGGGVGGEEEGVLEHRLEPGRWGGGATTRRSLADSRQELQTRSPFPAPLD